MQFDSRIKKILEDFNIFPRARHIQGRPGPAPGPNIDMRGPLPTGFKGANLPGIAPDAGEQVLIKLPQRKPKRKLRKPSKD